MRWLFCLMIAMYVLGLGAPALAQGDSRTPEEFAKNVALMTGQPGIEDDVLKRLLHDPQTVETLNKIWKMRAVQEPGILRDLNIEFQTFKVDGLDSLYAFGISYSYLKDFARRMLSPGSQSGMSLTFSSEGNVAFEKDTNPEDFLNSQFSIHVYKSWGGTIESSDEIRTELNRLEYELAGINDPDSLVNNPMMAKFLTISKQHMRDQLYLDFAIDGGLESDQAFETKQYTYGAQFGLDLKLWRSEHLNVFDWPFAAMRWLTGYDRELAPIGGTFPTILVALDRVNPTQDEGRKGLGESEEFTRVRAEIAFKTPLSATSFFELNFRYYKEMSAASAITGANLDEFTYFTSSLVTSQGMFVSYSTGKLPFDAKDDQIYELGFRHRF